MSSASATKRTGRTSLRSLISGRKGKDKGDNGSAVGSVVAEDDDVASGTNTPLNGSAKQQPREVRSTEPDQAAAAEASRTRRSSNTQQRDVRPPSAQPQLQESNKSKEVAKSDTSESKISESGTAEAPAARGRGGNVLQRLRERSRSRSRASSSRQLAAAENAKEMLVAVTSCRSDGYYNQKAPGSISKLPRKAPTNLKLFHELAVGVKDAYAAVGATPKNPTEEEKKKMGKDDLEARIVLWDFVGNLDFVSAQ